MHDYNAINKFEARDFLPSLFVTALSLLLFVLSYVAYIHHSLNSLCWILIVALVACATYVKLEFGVLALALELFLGGHGYLFSISIFGFVISIRIALFCIVAALWVIYLIRSKKIPKLFQLPIRKSFFLVCASLLLGICIGLIHHHGKLIFFDGNAYASFLLIPIFLDALQKAPQIKRLLKVLVSAVFAVSLVTLVFLGIYATFHYDESLRSAITLSDELYSKLNSELLDGNAVLGQSTNLHSAETQLNPLFLTKTKPISYRWLLDTGTAEISYISGRFFRVFFPSQMYLLIAIFVSITTMVFVKMRFSRKLLFGAITAIELGALYVGYSRSYWLGCIVGIVMALCATFYFSKKKKRFLIITGAILVSFVLLFASSNMLSTFSSRFETIFSPKHDVASAHRIQLAKGIWNTWQQHPIIGSGFGTTIVFPTIYANGKIFPTAFYVYEWSYFDVAVKTGLFGLLSFLWLLFSLGRNLFNRIKADPLLALGLLASLSALAIANITTPVFTHPLGIGALAILCCLTFYDSLPNTNRHVE